ncbi:MAG: (2Fe-2S)-binding protein [Alphaproteobacteria bacterium]|nr:(2Fe-2S)-binding protein [Alphaproteobacteria bacterium]
MTTETTHVRLTVNGRVYERTVEPRLLLVDFLRHELGLTGTHVGCAHGVCGACTVIMNGETVRTCITFAVQAEGAQIKTVEGLAENGRLNPIQQAFHENHALQCGYCTPGFLMTVTEFLDENPDPSENEIRHALAGNLCRCTGYVNIVRAVRAAAEKMRSGAVQR